MTAPLDDLYRDHAVPVWRYARARLPSDADAEDVVSDVFLRAHRSWGRYDRAQGPERAWLIGVARHAVADWWRKRDREGPSPTGAALVAAGETVADPADAVVRASEAADVRHSLAVLSPREREAIALRFGAELPSAEIGAALGISPTAARMLVHRAVTKLREVTERA